MKFIKIAAISFLAGNTVGGGKCMRMQFWRVSSIVFCDAQSS